MKFWRSRRGAVVILATLLLILFLVRPGVNRLRSRIVQSISLAVGRPVDVSWVRLRFLPQPGFDLENFVVHDDPAFSAEPLLQAQDVTASLRLTSLLRGKIDIARLSLTEPSINLVRNSQGRWNLEDLVERASKNNIAPTQKARTERRPGFPYIESDSGRINLKMGEEKTAFALTDADFSLWQDSENSWGMRLKARPVRTDFSLSDTGTVRVEGQWQRAASLRDTPLRFVVQWQQGQLGQASKLIYGSDKGWRGSIGFFATLAGKPSDLTVHADGSVDGLRHYDVLGGADDLAVSAHCDAHYSSADHILSNVLCDAPSAGGGTWMVHGRVGNPTGTRDFDLAVAARDIPMQSLLSFLRHAKRGLPDDLIASGQLNAKFQLRGAAGEKSATLEGSGEATGLELSSKVTGVEMLFSAVPLSISAKSGPVGRTRKTQLKNLHTPLRDAQVRVGPMTLALGKADGAIVRGTISATAYSFSLLGDADLQRLIQSFHAMGIAAPQTHAEGTAKLDLHLAGGWSDLRPLPLGKVQLRSVRAQPRGLNQPINIAAATLSFIPEQIEVSDLRATVAGASVTGNLSIPRHCEGPAECSTIFNLHADRIALDQVNLLLNPLARKQPWYHFLSAGSVGTPYLLSLNATGKISADQFVVHDIAANHVSASIALKDGTLRLSNLRGDLWEGKHNGDWTADFTAKPPAYTGTGTLEHVSLIHLTMPTDHTWITGSANASYSIATSGLTTSELFSSANCILQVDARNGQFPKIVLTEGGEPLQAQRLSLGLLLQRGAFNIREGELQTPTATFQLSGTATLDQGMDLKLSRGGVPVFSLTGTPEYPRVTAIANSETQVALKP